MRDFLIRKYEAKRRSVRQPKRDGMLFLKDKGSSEAFKKSQGWGGELNMGEVRGWRSVLLKNCFVLRKRGRKDSRLFSQQKCER